MWSEFWQLNLICGFLPQHIQEDGIGVTLTQGNGGGTRDHPPGDFVSISKSCLTGFPWRRRRSGWSWVSGWVLVYDCRGTSTKREVEKKERMQERMSGFSVNPKWHPSIESPRDLWRGLLFLFSLTRQPLRSISTQVWMESPPRRWASLSFDQFSSEGNDWIRNRHYPQQPEIGTGQIKET